ncbi:hypothetical protein [Pyrococcus kukulkanii]|uniref:DUF2067 domain-containing protein n=1 Tax=Pyrococcus kukulkanii TaxID=1609559 RepID=A0ABV4T5S0_9EURY
MEDRVLGRVLEEYGFVLERIGDVYTIKSKAGNVILENASKKEVEAFVAGFLAAMKGVENVLSEMLSVVNNLGKNYEKMNRKLSRFEERLSKVPAKEVMLVDSEKTKVLRDLIVEATAKYPKLGTEMLRREILLDDIFVLVGHPDRAR